MDDISAKINSILSDPESVAGLKEMAENLFGEQKSEKSEKPALPIDTDGLDIASLMSVLGKLKQGSDNENQRLLLALKPHLSKERQKKVDTAVKILKLLEIAPFLKESGILGGIL
jgi:hypothetical protein